MPSATSNHPERSTSKGWDNQPTEREDDGRMKTIANLIDELMNPDYRRSQEAKDSLIALRRRAVLPLLQAMSTQSYKHLWLIITVLERIGDPEAVPGIISCLHYDNTAIQAAAAHCLGSLGDERAIAPLLNFIDTHTESSAVIWVIEALGRLRAYQAVDRLIRLTRDTDSSVIRYTAIEALGYIGDRRAIDVIKACTTDENHHVRARVEKALSLLEIH